MFPVEPISGKMLDYYVGRKDSFLIDLRNPKEYHTGHIKGAVNVPYEEFEEMQTYSCRFLLYLCPIGIVIVSKKIYDPFSIIFLLREVCLYH